MRPKFENRTRETLRSKYHTPNPPKCKYCDKDAKRNTCPDGRNKGWYRTCGSDECTSSQYHDMGVSASKRPKHIERECAHCHVIYEARGWHQKWCSVCVPHKQARARMQRYGISEPTYQRMLREQNNLCAICKRRFPRCVDHSHITGIVRKLLCDGCNTRLSGIDDVAWLESALAYVSISFQSSSGVHAQSP